MVSAAIRTIFAQPDAVHVREQLERPSNDPRLCVTFCHVTKPTKIPISSVWALRRSALPPASAAGAVGGRRS
jgi:hypothetical protein